MHVGAPFAGASHTVPHAPQWFGSSFTSTHEPLQSVKPVWQLTPHVLATHTASPFGGTGQGSLHWPQCVLEVARSTQARLQSVSPAAQLAAHALTEQTWSLGQMVSQFPQ